MKSIDFGRFLALFVVISVNYYVSDAYSTDFDHSHMAYAMVLKNSVKGGLVDYKGLKSSPEGLNLYLDQLAAVSEKEFEAWTKQQQLAFLLNLYNAQTLRLVIDHYPIGSIKDLKEPWDRPVVRLFGKRISLNELEHNVIRKGYHEPRIHFALVCAAVGCPQLADEPYNYAELNKQLDEQGVVFLSDKSKNYLDYSSMTLYLSPIFDWFKEDFVTNSGSVSSFVNRYLPHQISGKINDESFRISYSNYDWSLNDGSKQAH